MKVDSIKAGQVLIIKTTEEPVLVLAVKAPTSDAACLKKFVKLDYETGTEVYEDVPLPGISGTEVIVRRPIMSEANGIAHLVDTFFVEELETMQERSKRFADEVRGSIQTEQPFVIPIDHSQLKN